MSVDVDHASRLHVGWVELHGAVGRKINFDAVQFEQALNNFNVANSRHIAQLARGVAKQSGNHCLGHKVFSALKVDAALQRFATANSNLTHRSPMA